MNQLTVNQSACCELDLPLDRDVFLRTLIREMAGTLEDVLGLRISGCRAVLFLKQTPDSASCDGREYFRSQSK